MSMFYRVLPTSLHDWLAPRRLRRFRPLRLDRANCWLQAFILNCWVQSGQMHRVDAFLVPGIFNLPVSWRQLVMAVAVRCNQQFQVDQVSSKMFQGIFAFARGQPGADFYRLIVLVPAPFAEDWQIWRSSRGLRRGGKSCAVDMMPGQSVESQQWRRWVTMGHLAPLCDKFCLFFMWMRKGASSAWWLKGVSALQCPKNNPIQWCQIIPFRLGHSMFWYPWPLPSCHPLRWSGDLGAQVLLLGQLCSRLGLLFGTESAADSMGQASTSQNYRSSADCISFSSPSKHFQTHRFCNCGSMCWWCYMVLAHIFADGCKVSACLSHLGMAVATSLRRHGDTGAVAVWEEPVCMGGQKSSSLLL